MASVVVLVQTSTYGAPTATACKQFRDKYGHDDVVTLYAPTNQLNPLWDNNYTALSVFVDSDRVIQGKAHTDNKTSLTASISALLQ